MNEATTMVATNVKVFDGVHEELVEGHVVVSGSKIVEVTETMPSTGDDVEVIDGDGRVLMPGLTDAHCHIMGMCHSLPAMMQGDIGWIYANTVAAAERTLMRGFTTVRDAGGPVFGIKQAIDLGT
ncbi:MAG: amidohydrolase family protein, partial [Candidatus Microthrix parvicella]